MPIASCMAFIKQLLDGLDMPGGAPELAAWITAPDPDVDPAAVPTCYIWPMPGREARDTRNAGTMPRNQGPNATGGSGFKTIKHEIGIWLVWFQDENDPDADTLFPGYVDALMNALRTSFPNPALLTDPWTGVVTQLANTGEDMAYDSPPPRSVSDQRYLRYDCLLRVPLIEVIQA